MINYGVDVIYDNRKALSSFSKWAQGAASNNLTPPTSDQIFNGVVPLNTLPASWFNFYHQAYTVNLQMLSQLTYDLYSELLAVLADGGVTPSMGTQQQLKAALYNIMDAHLADGISDQTITFAALSSGQQLDSGDSLATLFGKLAGWRAEWTPVAHQQLIASTTVTGHVSVVPANGLNVDASGQVSIELASDTENGTMSSTDKQRLDNVYQGVLNVTCTGGSDEPSEVDINITKANGGPSVTIPLPLATSDTTGTDDDGNPVTIAGKDGLLSGPDKTALEALKLFASDIVGAIYPVGSIYMTTNPADPSTYFVGTTWERYAKGRVLIGVNPDDAAFNAADKTGGATTVTLTTANLAAHSHGGATLYSGAHNHYLVSNNNPQTYVNFIGSSTGQSGTGLTFVMRGNFSTSLNPVSTAGTTTVDAHNHRIDNQGNSDPFQILNPYITCYIWTRTA